MPSVFETHTNRTEPHLYGFASTLTQRRSAKSAYKYHFFGETFVDQTPATNPYDSRYTFSAKEKDDETSYSYFGARYYDSDLSVWLSVDPMADKLPMQTPYMYCNGNPVILVDPDGEFPWLTGAIGAVAGAVTEFVGQTVSIGMENISNGQGFFNGWSDKMDWADVAISGGEGFLIGATCGVSLLVVEGGAATARASVDWNSDGVKYVGGSDKHKKDIGTASMDLVSELISSGTLKFAGVDKIKVDPKNLSEELFVGGIKDVFGGITDGATKNVQKTGANKINNFFSNLFGRKTTREGTVEALPPNVTGIYPAEEIDE